MKETEDTRLRGRDAGREGKEESGRFYGTNPYATIPPTCVKSRMTQTHFLVTRQGVTQWSNTTGCQVSTERSKCPSRGFYLKSFFKYCPVKPLKLIESVCSSNLNWVLCCWWETWSHSGDAFEDRLRNAGKCCDRLIFYWKTDCRHYCDLMWRSSENVSLVLLKSVCLQDVPAVLAECASIGVSPTHLCLPRS